MPSIASVARLTLESRIRGGDGWRRIVDNGALEREEPCAIPPGTIVRVEQLFARVPARRKFLRSPRSEYAACLDAVRRIAMAHPEISFEMEHDGRRTLSVSIPASIAPTSGSRASPALWCRPGLSRPPGRPHALRPAWWTTELFRYGDKVSRRPLTCGFSQTRRSGHWSREDLLRHFSAAYGVSRSTRRV